jgi:AraC-like DNA-binding protein
MNYQTYQPHPDLTALIKCYWTLEVPADFEASKQRIISDGCLEMAFVLGDDIKRYTSENTYILQPRAMVIGQITEPFFIQPTGYVNTFAVRFYPYGFANFINTPIKELSNTETPIAHLFDNSAVRRVEQRIIEAKDTKERIAIIENFLLCELNRKTTVDKIVQTTIEALISTSGNTPINNIIKSNLAKRRQLERKFAKQIGLSPKQMGKVIRLQTALKMLLNKKSEKLSNIAYESEYYDQAHFIRDFKEFTGTSPTAFLDDKSLMLSSLCKLPQIRR